MKTVLIVIGVFVLAILMIAAFVAADAYTNTDEYEGRDE
jgi:ABC-type cobalt transport system substrate-binding protein